MLNHLVHFYILAYQRNGFPGKKLPYPEAVGVLISNGHQVVIEHNAGEAAHYRDKDYSEAGARIVYEKAEVFKAPFS